MTDINAVIAAFREPNPSEENGRVHINCVSEGGNWLCNKGHDPETNEARFVPVDFQHDAGLYMALFEEIGKERLIELSYEISVVTRKPYVICRVDMEKFWRRSESDTIGTAICLAYMRLHGLECEK